jgi:predicted AlkP superfamily phosphohydrolase/phosphomutase
VKDMAKDITKVSVVGLDGANRKILDLLGLNNEGISANLISTIPPLTPPAWTSILTGVNQGKHGIFGWQNVNIKERRIRLNNSIDVKYPRLFELLSKKGLTNIIINVPLVYPFEGIANLKNNIIVTDWASPLQTIYPAKLYNMYEEYFIDPPHTWSDYENVTEYVKNIHEFITMRLNLYYDLLEKYDWNLFFIVFSEIDWLLHKIPQLLEGKELQLVQPIFEEIRKFFDKSRELSDVTFIVSDHGFEAKNLRMSVNQVLKQHHQIKTNLFKSNMIKVVRKVFPRELLNNLVRKLSEKASLPTSSIALEADMIDSNAFMVEAPTWGVFVNRNISKVTKIFKEMPEIKQVLNCYDLYKGPYTEYAPNLILIPKEGVVFSKGLSDGIHTKIYQGNHEMKGIFFATGDIINKNGKLSKIPIVYDIAPTILHLFGLPVPRDMDGMVLKGIFREDSEPAQREVRYQAVDMEREKVKDQIKTLKKSGRL